MPEAYSRPLRNLYALACVVVLVAALYFARSVLIPIVLAVLLTFLLSPLMLAAERRGLPRLAAAVAVVLATLLLLAGAGLLISGQLRLLMADLPRHRESILAKVEALRDGASDSWLSGVSGTLTEVRERLAQAQEGVEKPTPVEVVPSHLAFAHTALSPLADSLVGVGLVLVLTFFMLLRREDLRNRILRLWGPRRLPRATQALDDAGRRISSFLLTQLAVNTAFGLVYGLALFAIGVPYPLLGGFLGGLLRYVPFVGAWVAGAGPVLLSVALLPGWWHVGLIVAVTAALEGVFAHLIEPFAFGRSIGVSEVALLIALAFWGWLWGVAGMVLATPLTACLVVLSRHVPRLRFLATLLGDEPALKPPHALYQRMLANDTEEADRLVTEFRAEHGGEEVYPRLLLPVVRLAKLHLDHGQISGEEELLVYRQLRELLPAVACDDGEPARCPVVGFPTGEVANEVALELFARLLPRGVAFEADAASALVSEVVGRARDGGPGVVLLPVLTRGGLRQVRLLMKRLRKECPRSRVLVAWWGSGRLPAAERRRLIEAGADGVATSLADARAQLSAMLPVAREAEREEPAPAGS